jgi:alpha-L-fucosidase
VTTRKGNRVYVHVLDWPDTSLLLPGLPSAVRSAHLLSGGRAVDFKSGDFGVVLSLPREALDPIDTVVVLELEPRAAR